LGKTGYERPFMNSYPRRVLTSLVPPLIFIFGFPIAAVLLDDTHGIVWLRDAPQSYVASLVGVIAIIFGLALVVKTIPLFLRLSEGTIMPWEPTTELIVEGVYRDVRNPMHTGVFAIMFGEGLVSRSVLILVFVAFAVLLHLLYIPFSEERGLERRFGEEYRVYKENVPRWIPRTTPWEPGDT
jgi:protein-S-isoprenylcysteine O-methyltransferase Ste14